MKPVRCMLLSLHSCLAACAALTTAGCQHQKLSAPTSVAAPGKTEQHYAHLFGHRYRTKIDLYLFTFTADPEFKYVGRNDGNFPNGPHELPADVTRDNLNRTFTRAFDDGMGQVKILDVIPAGAELVIEAETHEVTAISGVRGASGYPMGFICKLIYGGKGLDGVLTEFIQSHREVSEKVPNQDLNERVAEKIIP